MLQIDDSNAFITKQSRMVQQIESGFNKTVKSKTFILSLCNTDRTNTG